MRLVPQQQAWIVERLGKFRAVLQPGLNLVIPFVDRVAYKHSLKELPLDAPSQICGTRENTQLQVDGVLFDQVTDPQRASYGSSHYVLAIIQLAQTTLRSLIGRMARDKTCEERERINASVVTSIDEAALNRGVKVLRCEIKDLTPPAEILRAIQAQITAERDKRALIASSEGRKQEQINIATGEREGTIVRSEGQKQAQINIAQGRSRRLVGHFTDRAGESRGYQRAGRGRKDCDRAPNVAATEPTADRQLTGPHSIKEGDCCRAIESCLPGNHACVQASSSSAWAVAAWFRDGTWRGAPHRRTCQPIHSQRLCHESLRQGLVHDTAHRRSRQPP